MYQLSCKSGAKIPEGPLSVARLCLVKKEGIGYCQVKQEPSGYLCLLHLSHT